jgi:hypothetical protein
VDNTQSLDPLDPPVEYLPNEEWLPVVDHEESYLISSYGRLFSRIHRRLLNPVGGRRVVLAGQARDIGALVLESHGKQPRPAAGMIAWPIDRDARWPYSDCRWITRAEMLTTLSGERAVKLAEGARANELGSSAR